MGRHEAFAFLMKDISGHHLASGHWSDETVLLASYLLVFFAVKMLFFFFIVLS
jgi:hypothetical protein